MVQGTTSDAGKSTLVAALCRIFANTGQNIAPFKPQNMALNSAVTPDGGEIGRAQALQAIAAKVPLQTDFNPILLKPNSDTGAQVIIHGKAISNMEADHYHDYKKVALNAVLESHQRLAQQFDILFVEGAGSPAEINLRENDIANMGYAETVNCPVIIIADIDKGGVFAHLVGTLSLLSPSEQSRVKGFVINRFRGDIALLQSGLEWLEQRTNKPVLGVLPYMHDLALDAEDAISLDNKLADDAPIKTNIAVLLLPHISNHTDFDSLRLNPQVDLQYIRIGQNIGSVDLIIIPGSKNVISDLTFLVKQGWQAQITKHLRYGGKVLGICGGYQMLGNSISDPLAIESTVPSVRALGLLDFETSLAAKKKLTQVSGSMTINNKSCQFSGYEIHCGVSQGAALDNPLIKREGDNNLIDGCISDDQLIIGTYIHGIFDTPDACQLILEWVNNEVAENSTIDLDKHREEQLEKLAEVFAKHLDLPKIQQIIDTGCEIVLSKEA